MQKYNSVSGKVIYQLKEIVGDKYVYTDNEKMEPYSHDEVAGSEYMQYPEVVVLPETAEQIAAIVRLANENIIPIVPRGAGTGLSCAAVPFLRGIVVSVERLNKIIELDTTNMFIVVEPGVTTDYIQKTANASGFLYAGDPSSGDSSFIGGNVATNAGGNKAVKYGTTRRQIYGLEFVSPQGKIITLGGKCVKDTTGYNLFQLLIGSEGTLGIITKIYIKLIPLPEHSMNLLAIFPDLVSAIQTVPKIMSAGVAPVSVEFMDNLVVQNCEDFLREKLPHSDDGYYIIVQIEGNNEEVLEDQCVTIDEICMASGAITVLVADSSKIWKARKCVAEADRARSLIFASEDLVVPMSAVSQAVQKVVEIGKKYGVRVHCAGHAGDGNVHANILKEDIPEDKWHEIVPQSAKIY
ncbi:MAG: FAD-binding protein [Firmicutes bacterium]|nr:FAD-binding protein [Bacillota bacterium]